MPEVEASVVHRCPLCNGRHSIWAKGAFAKGTHLVVRCAKCAGFFEFSDGQTRPARATTTAGGVADFIRCNWRMGDRACGTPLASGTMGRGSTVEMKCRRCRNFCAFYV